MILLLLLLLGATVGGTISIVYDTFYAAPQRRSKIGQLPGSLSSTTRRALPPSVGLPRGLPRVQADHTRKK